MYYGEKVRGILFLLLIPALLPAQESDSVYRLTGTVYDDVYRPLAGTHVVNLNSHQGEVSDELGIFSMPVRTGDTLLFRNIVYRDTLVAVKGIGPARSIVLRKMFYELSGATIYPWGSSYGDFKRAVVTTPAPVTLSESLGLPRQDPFYVPFDMDEDLIKSTGFMLTSPVSYIYHNLSRREKNRRRAYWLQRDREEHEIFNEITGPENLARVSGLQGEELLAFMSWFYERLVCDHKCSELDIHKEVHALWGVYRDLHHPD